ncbi:hypothetical protein BJV77DRAFT_1060254 [Russula vinacea]|nr:hypothetical protein BJV77DRAFT_1060254 [Russula vinacea]
MGLPFLGNLVDPQASLIMATQVSFFACPATGQVSWDPPVGNFVLPPSENGEWWEIGDETRGGIPYYYHTKTGETVWEKPDSFVIPLTVLQGPAQAPRLQSSASGPAATTKKNSTAPPVRRNLTTDPHYATPTRLAPALPPIPGSEASAPPTPTPSHHSLIPSREPPQSLAAAVERITVTPSQSPGNSSESGYVSGPESPPVKPRKRVEAPEKNSVLTKPVRPPPSTPTKGPTVAGKEIGRPVLNMGTFCSYTSSAHPILPQDLASDIQQFVESEFAQQYFATHRTGFIFKRKVPVGQMMTWQRGPLAAPLLNLARPLHRDAVRAFRAVQRLMGDSEKGAATGSNTHRLEEARWLLGQGLAYGELRDEIYCQVMKQLTSNPNAESTFRGWQLLCVLLVTFPPSKNFEPYLRAFLSQRTGITRHCLKRLAAIAKKGPRGKPPTLAEIETASDAAFNPSTFGEPLDAVFRLQERTYPTQKVPIVLPFLADGVLALGGTKAEGIFRVPGDSDAVASLKMRLDRGAYTLEGVDDPHVPASLFKLWLRELVDPLVPSEMYNDCIAFANDAEACCAAVERLPTANRRVVLFMTSANLALVMAPNLLRCGSDSMAVVFNNAQYEQAFVHNLLVHLKCGEIDPHYTPTHGHGAVPSAAPPRTSRSRNRRAHP